jgi:dihydroorotase
LYDLLIKGGTVVDPSQNLHAVRDVALADGLVAAVEASIDGSAAETIDATGLIVSPGLMDLHVHAFWGGSTYGIEPDAGNISRGVTTAVDAGSAGAWTFPAFRSHVMDRADTRLFALLNISAAGMVFHDNAELHDLAIADVGQAVEAGKLNSDVVVGIKARLGRVQAADNDADSLKRAIEAAEAIDGFVMIHVGNSATPLPDLMRMLRPGDAVTHSFLGFADGVLESSGAVIDGMKEAQARGVVIDVGHGAGGFSFPAAEKALSEGVLPGTISSDLHIGNIEGPVFDLVTTLSKFMHLGMSLDEVIRRCTETAARTIGQGGRLGTLRLGSHGDVTILRIEEGRFTLRDRLSTSTSLGRTWWEPPASVEASRRLAHVSSIKAGRVYRPWLRPT